MGLLGKIEGMQPATSGDAPFGDAPFGSGVGMEGEMPAAAMRVQGLSKTYRGGQRAVLALDDIDFEVGEGEFVSIVGPSGCGKSTL